MQHDENLTPEQMKRKRSEVLNYITNHPAKGNQRNLLGLSPDMLRYISTNFLPLSDARRLANTCQRFLFFTPKMKDVIRRAAAEVHRFLTCVLNSDLASVKQMLILDPDLLLESHPVGEHGNMKGLPLARRLGDSDMYQMMLECAEGQIELKLPANINRKKIFNKKHVEKIVKVIVACDEQTVVAEHDRHRNPHYQITELGKEMDKFRKICDEHGEMTPQDVINAFKVMQNGSMFSAWNKNSVKFKNYLQSNLFFVQVVGYIERLTPAWFRQALIEGIDNLLQPNVTLQRVTESSVNNVDYPLVSLIPFSGLGFDIACDDMSAEEAWSDGPAEIWIMGLKEFVEQQNQKFNELNQQYKSKAVKPQAKRLKR